MAERLVYRPDCGCEVYRIMNHKPNLYRIQYCLLHGAAIPMRDALEGIISKRMENHETEAAYIPPEVEAVYKALSQAKEGEKHD